MTDNFPHSAAQNISLLEAISQGPAESLTLLAARADLDKSNMNRKLGVLTEDGLIASVGPASHQVELTEAGRQALVANAVFRGEVAATPGGITEIPFNLIDAWAGNPRTQFDPAKTEELAVSIGDKGVLQAIKVRPKGDRYEVIIGERRRRASALAVERGWQPADFAIPAEIRDYSDEEAEEVAGVENMQREDMHWMDEAKWYLSLSHRHSGPSIERLVGGIRGKRSIQDYIKCARELSAPDVAKTYLPDGDKDQLTYVRARDLVGEKKERPALDLSAKLTVALLETIACGIAQAERDTYVSAGPLTMPPLNAPLVTRFAKAPVGGPLSTLSNDRKLTSFGFEGRDVVARTKITEDVHRWLTQLGFPTDPHGALFRARAAVIGEMQTHAMEREGRCLTDELNFPKPAASVSPADPEDREDEDELDPAAVNELIRTSRDADEDDADIPPFLRRLAGDYSEPQSAAQLAGPTPQRMVEAPPTGAAAASPPPPAPAPIAPAPLPAMLEIIVVELAHKMGAGTLRSPAGGFGAPVLADYYKDNRIGQLVQGWKLLGVHPAGEKTLAIQTDAARAFLVEDYGLEDIDGRVTLDDAVLEQAQMRLLGVKPSPGPYSTPWLNPPPKAETPAVEPEAAPLAPPAAEAEEEFDRIGRLAGEARAIASLASAARTAAGLLSNLKSRSKAPKAEDVDPTIRLIEAALEACAALLPKEEI